jgi:hypothetical protein
MLGMARFGLWMLEIVEVWCAMSLDSCWSFQQNDDILELVAFPNGTDTHIVPV